MFGRVGESCVTSDTSVTASPPGWRDGPSPPGRRSEKPPRTPSAAATGVPAAPSVDLDG
jgi:hypothetical protein